jgi:ubiquinone biosynthesis UbiH/UbiF/VisC/COQ6 family hydroxylase
VQSSHSFDIAVVGAGVAGLAAAVGSAQLGLRVVLVGPRAAVRRAEAAAPFDVRIYALAPATVALLQQLKVWPAVEPTRVQPVTKMRVFGDAGNELCFDAYQASLASLATIVEESELLRALGAAAAFAQGLERVEAPFDSLHPGENGSRLRLADGRAIEARLVLAADGARSAVRAAAGINARELAYAQTAVVANFGCERPHQGVALQWFDPDEGVIALLPLPGDHVSLVWSAPPLLAEALLAEPSALPLRLAARAQRHLGVLTAAGPAQSFALRRVTVDRMIGPRLALVGDAAHVVHPLAGQGLNLGLADVSELLHVLAAREAWRDVGDKVLLRRYERLRAEPVELMRVTTHALARLFARQDRFSRELRNIGLSAVDAVLPLKNALIRHAAGADHRGATATEYRG